MAKEETIYLEGLPVNGDFQMQMDSKVVTDGTESKLILKNSGGLDWVQFPNNPEGTLGTLSLFGDPSKFLGMNGTEAVVADEPLILAFSYFTEDMAYEMNVPGQDLYLTDNSGAVCFMAKGGSGKKRWKFRKTVSVL